MEKGGDVMAIRIIRRTAPAPAPEPVVRPQIVRPRRKPVVKPLDGVLDEVLAQSPNMAVPWFLMASWLYYHRDVLLLSDERYDRLCQQLDAEWDAIEHDHKPVIDRPLLKAGTAFSIPDAAYPTRVVSAACALAEIPQPPLISRAQYAPLKR
jgi:hypothetical protein